MNTSSQLQEWNLPAGTTVKIGGLPYRLLADVRVSGFHEPCELSGHSGTASQNGPDQPPAETPGQHAGLNRRSVASDGSAIFDTEDSETNDEQTGFMDGVLCPKCKYTLEFMPRDPVDRQWLECVHYGCPNLGVRFEIPQVSIKPLAQTEQVFQD